MKAGREGLGGRKKRKEGKGEGMNKQILFMGE